MTGSHRPRPSAGSPCMPCIQRTKARTLDSLDDLGERLVDLRQRGDGTSGARAPEHRKRHAGRCPPPGRRGPSGEARVSAERTILSTRRRSAPPSSVISGHRGARPETVLTTVSSTLTSNGPIWVYWRLSSSTCWRGASQCRPSSESSGASIACVGPSSSTERSRRRRLMVAAFFCSCLTIVWKVDRLRHSVNSGIERVPVEQLKPRARRRSSAIRSVSSSVSTGVSDEMPR